MSDPVCENIATALTREEAEQALNNHIADVHKKESNLE